jgi:exodeoxyribonuclease V alpha subunit
MNEIDPSLVASIPRDASTIHRALGYQPRTPTRFRHNAHNPLPVDVVVVDEASMVDLALMTKLVEAVPPSARLILLGDKDQLVSVEAGAILGDIYAEAEPGFSEEFVRRVHEVTGERLPTAKSSGAPDVQDCLVHLTRSYRYPEGSAIAEFARAVNRGDADAALSVIDGNPEPLAPAPRSRKKRVALNQLSFGFAHHEPLFQRRPELEWVELRGTDDFARRLGPVIDRGFSAYVSERDPRRKLARLSGFRVLCAHRRGDLGAQTLNRWVEERLADRAGLNIDREFYDGRPLLITRNDYQLDLYNGDVGVVAPDSDGLLKAWFVGDDTRVRSFLPARLPPHETVFCMTVHKSQGSEFDRVLLVLPERPSPIVTRELLYTGVTRARTAVHLVASRSVLKVAINQRVERASGLREALWGE